ncbi:MAG: hypothetical protein ACTSRP_09455 [Candidatus Helarchaeota archaeon]
MKWSFIIELGKDSKLNKSLTLKIEEKAKEVVNAIGAPKKKLFKIEIIFFQRKSRWKLEDPQIPREDISIDLDNLLKYIFDGLDPIIGYRIKYDYSVKPPIPKLGENAGVTDSRIIDVHAKKVNSGCENEYLSIEIEEIN